MLQQTRVEAVRDYFDRFVEAVPDIRALAEIPEEQLLKLWEGLGYYSRAKNLKKTAQILVERADEAGVEPALPGSSAELVKLPGIGPYTAGAIASNAFGERTASVDGNVLRVCMRLAGDPSDITLAQTRKDLTACLSAALPAEQPGLMNQAWMELGAVVCLPNGEPQCGSCPLVGLCEAKRQGRIAELPVKTPKKARRIEEMTVFLITSKRGEGVKKEQLALLLRPARGLLSDLYEFPNCPGSLSETEALGWLSDCGFRVPAGALAALPPAVHIFTHIEWHMTVYRAAAAAEGPDLMPDGRLIAWVDRARLDRDYPLPTAFRKLLR